MSLACAATESDAATFTWDGGGTTTNWSDDLNWAGNVEPPKDGTATIDFAATSETTSTVTDYWEIESLHFDNAAPAMTLPHTSSHYLTVHGPGGLGFGLTNFSDNLHMIETRIDLAGSQPWNNVAGSMEFSEILNLNNHSLVFTVNGDIVTLSGILAGGQSGELIKSGSSELSLVGGFANTFPGTTRVNQGTLSLGKSLFANPALPGPPVIGDGSGGVEADKVVLLGNAQIDGDVTVNSSGVLDLNGHDEYLADLTLSAGRVKTGAGLLALTN